MLPMLTTSQFLDHLTRSKLISPDVLGSLNGDDPQTITTTLSIATCSRAGKPISWFNEFLGLNACCPNSVPAMRQLTQQATSRRHIATAMHRLAPTARTVIAMNSPVSNRECGGQMGRHRRLLG